MKKLEEKMWDVPVIFLFSDQIRKKMLIEKRCLLLSTKVDLSHTKIRPKKDELLHSKARKELS